MRLEAQVKGGFYPAHPEAVGMICDLLQPPEGRRFTILDPCAGEGYAINQIWSALDCHNDDVFAVELSDSRGPKVGNLNCIANALAPADFFATSISVNAFGLIWCNPPFDDEIGGGKRVESSFLRRATQLLAPHGIMCFVCPEDTARSHDIKRQFKEWYTDVNCIPFPAEHRKYNEVVVMGVKREESVSAWSMEFGWKYGVRVNTPYQIPPTKHPQSWRKTGMTPAELADALERSPLSSILDAPPVPPLASPPLALGTGHMSLLLASGMLNGIVRPDDEPPHVVRGTGRKQKYTKSSDYVEDEDGKGGKQVTVIAERFNLTVRTVDQSGVIRTFDQHSIEDLPEDPKLAPGKKEIGDE